MGPSAATPHPPHPTARTGILCALGGFTLWGLFPIYFKALAAVPAMEVLAHRIVGSVGLLAILLSLTGGWSGWWLELNNWRKTGYYLATTLLIAGNWLVYIWAVQNGHVLGASLGYYINPLVSVLLGVVFLREKLSRWQGLAVLLAAAGVSFLVFRQGSVPWISLVLAASFGSYGLLRKRAGVNPLLSLFLETLLLSPFALTWLIVLAVQGQGALGTVDMRTNLLLLSAGVITVVPLMLFLESMRHLRLATVGLLQYLTPTLQFLLAVALYHEPFSATHLVTFSFIWIALGIYSADAFAQLRASTRDRSVELPP
ncbi:MAG: EamA family transporter RarD [Gammaproteobacteria bacterium]|nr:EamA family transporter RarD [Gammaproteobacteria bacterium]MCP5425512.1 EamA family transporter RarD [Gammaproteobacteria bacterium]